jgi:hypothetical protein
LRRLINLLGIPASILGNELVAARVGRRRYILTRDEPASALLAWPGGLFARPLAWWLTLALLSLHFVAVMGDSAAFTGGPGGGDPGRRTAARQWRSTRSWASAAASSGPWPSA